MKPKILIIGASGFIGAGVLDYLIRDNYQVMGLGRKDNPWRIHSSLKEHYQSLKDDDVTVILNKVQPEVIINFAANGAYSFQNDFVMIVNSNLILLDKIANWSMNNGCYLINAGTSSEYGNNSPRPKEDSLTKPNSLYAITKVAGTNLLEFYASQGLQSVVLRLYSVYGPKEDSSRLMPAVMRGIIKGEWPSFTDPDISRDFVYLDDICKLLVKLVQQKENSSKGTFGIYNVGTGIKTTIRDLTNILEREFGMPKREENSFPKRKWDVKDWYANIDKVIHEVDWQPNVDLKSGLNMMRDWYLLEDNVKYLNNEYSENK
jgi:dolichol-phosphate mannosyltransferase